jgi:1,2-diacylglycerol 3-alpha-glucosyltransferase
MRILFVSDTYFPHLNGVYYFVCRIAPLLQEKGHQVAVIAPSETIYSTLKKIDGIDVFGIPSLPVLYYPVRFPIPLIYKSKISHILKEFKPDIIHIQDHFSLSKATVKLGKKSDIPIIGTNHFMTENLTSFIHNVKWKTKLSTFLWSQFSNIYNQLSLVTTPSEMAANLIRPKLTVDVISISSGIDLTFFTPFGDTQEVREKYSIPEKPILLYVGRLDPEKNLEEILYAVAKALKKIDFCLVIVGKGIKKPALEKLSQDLGIADQVIFTGFIPEDILPYMYKLSRCFIIASTAELLSLSTLQAMASGLPIIAVNAGALSEIVHDKINGYLFNAGDTEAIVESIYHIFIEDDLYQKMSEMSLAYISKHDIYKTVESFEETYQSRGKQRFVFSNGHEETEISQAGHVSMNK